MKRLVMAAVAVLCLTDCASAEPAALKVRTSDLNLSSAEGRAQLENRLLRRMWAICGKPTDAALTQANTGGGAEQREACKAELHVSPDDSVGVRAAFEAALKRF